MKKVMFGAVLGAALVYAFDPQLGARRRDRVRELLGGGPAVPPAPDVPIDLLIVDERSRAGVS